MFVPLVTHMRQPIESRTGTPDFDSLFGDVAAPESTAPESMPPPAPLRASTQVAARTGRCVCTHTYGLAHVMGCIACRIGVVMCCIICTDRGDLG